MGDERNNDPNAAGAEVTDAEVTTVESDAWEKEWNRRVDTFAGECDLAVDKVQEALTGFLGEPSKKKLEQLTDEKLTPFGDLRDCLVDNGPCKLPALRANVRFLRGDFNTAMSTTGGSSVQVYRNLEPLPTDLQGAKFTEALKAGGRQKVEPIDVMAAIKVYIAQKYNLFTIPANLMNLFTQHSDSLNEPWSDEVYAMYSKIEAEIAKSRSGEFLKLLKIPGKFVAKKHRDEFVERINRNLMPAVEEFSGELFTYFQTWNNSSNPNQMSRAITAALTHNDQMAEMLTQPPETGTVRDAIERLNDAVNRTFRGPGIPVARAIAFEADSVLELLNIEGLEQYTGSANREELLTKLNVSTNAADMREEINLAMFVWNSLQFQNAPQDGNEIVVLNDLYYLASQIWKKNPRGRTANINFEE